MGGCGCVFFCFMCMVAHFKGRVCLCAYLGWDCLGFTSCLLLCDFALRGMLGVSSGLVCRATDQLMGLGLDCDIW